MSTWLVPRSELTPDQLRAVELPHKEHQVIYGAPGSGKTMVLLHRAHELRQRMGSSSDKFRIVVFTRVLKSYIRSGLALLDLPESSVTTFDDWCRKFYEARISRYLPWNYEERKPDFEAVRRAVADWITERSTPPLFDFVMVDEGQDLDGICFEILRRVARHVTVCMDHRQQIYEGGSTESEVLQILGLRRRQVTLLDAYRCSPYVARLAAQLLRVPEEREQYLNQVRTVQKERETPLLYIASDFEDEKQRLIDVLRQRLLVDQRIAVLFPLKRQVHGFATGLREAGIEVEDQENLHFASRRPKLITIHSAKGLTFDTVLLPRIVPASFPEGKSGEKLRNLLFVAITRAERWVYLSTVNSKVPPIVRELEKLAATRQITVQRFEEAPDIDELSSHEYLDEWHTVEDEDELDFL
ncbi:MAG: 3'-5' exonuclease [Chloroherpetonaceae bacterium]|nr:AAA family ATPase [Chthonomonadaceae bacterium]MDW8208974.1 3'-5' exonuclease [Chloroherpetonaceae bacterium]